MTAELNQEQTQVSKDDVYRQVLVVDGMPDRQQNTGGDTGQAVYHVKMAKTMAPIVADALEHADIKAKIGKQEVWDSTKDSWNQDYRKLKKAPVPI